MATSGSSASLPAAGATHGSGRVERTTLAQRFALAVGVVFLLVGIAGFVPGVTTPFDELRFAGHHSDAQLLGLFNVSVLHNLVHLAFGVAGVLTARRHDASTAFLLGGGVIYLVLSAYGFVIDHDTAANFVPVDRADDWLHLGLGLGMVALGLIGRQAADAGRHPRSS